MKTEDTEKNLNQLVEFISTLNSISSIDLLPYNELSENKYKKISKKFDLKNHKTQSEITVNKIKKIFQPLGCEISIRG